jgi:hypothetical protein
MVRGTGTGSHIRKQPKTHSNRCTVVGKIEAGARVEKHWDRRLRVYSLDLVLGGMDLH